MKMLINNSLAAHNESWTLITNYEEALILLGETVVDELEITGSLGEEHPEAGIEILEHLIYAAVNEGKLPPPVIRIRSESPRLRKEMEAKLRVIEKCRTLMQDGKTPLRVYLDDQRELPDDSWALTKTPAETIALLETGCVVELSLDHDLGMENETVRNNNGYEVVLWLEEHVILNDFVPPPIIKAHTANTAARERMELTVE